MEKKLTDPTIPERPAVADNMLFYAVDPNDLTDDPAGSSVRVRGDTIRTHTSVVSQIDNYDVSPSPILIFENALI